MISAKMHNCLNVTDLLNPQVLQGSVEFDPSTPLTVAFTFDWPAGPTWAAGTVVWAVGRQLVLDGLETDLMTGLGDFRCYTSGHRFMVRLAGDRTAGDTMLSLPVEQVRFVLDEAERLAPMADVLVELDDAEIAAWLDGS